ncbi:unnamed protein product [Closterium sp. Yama58-4]|nr:unnamed protein product [Closterium sp. Yama58-4]
MATVLWHSRRWHSQRWHAWRHSRRWRRFSLPSLGGIFVALPSATRPLPRRGLYRQRRGLYRQQRRKRTATAGGTSSVARISSPKLSFVSNSPFPFQRLAEADRRPAYGWRGRMTMRGDAWREARDASAVARRVSRARGVSHGGTHDVSRGERRVLRRDSRCSLRLAAKSTCQQEREGSNGAGGDGRSSYEDFSFLRRSNGSGSSGAGGDGRSSYEDFSFLRRRSGDGSSRAAWRRFFGDVLRSRGGASEHAGHQRARRTAAHDAWRRFSLLGCSVVKFPLVAFLLVAFPLVAFLLVAFCAALCRFVFKISNSLFLSSVVQESRGRLHTRGVKSRSEEQGASLEEFDFPSRTALSCRANLAGAGATSANAGLAPRE